MKKGFSLLAITLFAAILPPAAACGETDDLLSGFDEAEIVVTEPEQPGITWFSEHFSGYAKLFTAFNTTHNRDAQDNRDWHGLSGLRLEGQIEADFRMAAWKTFVSLKGFYDLSYEINGRGEYSSSVLEAYEKELEVQEAFVQGSLAANIDLKAGRQIVVWGRSDNFRVTDVLNPLDNREPGLTDIENLRIPVCMTKLDIFSGLWNLDMIAVHEHRYDKNPPAGHLYSPLTAALPPE